jgi:hypothetical protein
MTTPNQIILPSDAANTGKQIDNIIVVTENSASVYRQVITVGDPNTGANRQTVNASGGAGVTNVPLLASQLTPVVINSASGGNIPICAGVAGKTVKLHRLLLVMGAPTNITIEDGTTSLSGPMPFFASGTLVLDFTGDPWYASSLGNALNINSSNAVQISGTAWYVQN